MWAVIKAIALDRGVHIFIVCMIVFWGLLYIAVSWHWKRCQSNPHEKIVCVDDDCQCVDKDAEVKVR